jgi:hypothetical protein
MESPGTVTKLTVTYDGKYSASRTQTLHLFDFSNNSWTQVDSRSVGTADVTVSYVSSSPGSFISSVGEIRLRVRATASRNSTFSCSGDFMQFTVESSGGSIPVPGSDEMSVHRVSTLPEEFRLYQNSPNPFNPSTGIWFDISEAGHVSLRVYNTLGQEVAVLVDDYREPGAYQVRFEASGLPSGIYFYQLRTGGQIITQKMSLVR